MKIICKQGIIVVILFSLIIMLFGCGKDFSNNSISSDSKTDYDSLLNSEKELSDINSYEDNYILKEDNNIKLLFASQEKYYISQGYIEPHFMVYWIDNDDYAYSAIWKTNDNEPTKAFKETDSFENTKKIGLVSFDEDFANIVNDISDKELIKHEYEEQDVEFYGKWLYGCQYVTFSGSPLLIYHVTPDFSEYLNDSQTTALVNKLYEEPTFQQAREIWNEIYEVCSKSN